MTVAVEPVSAVGEFHPASASDTARLGLRLAAALKPGHLVALSGDLGAGKTCLIQGIAEGLGVTDIVNSPTFVLLNLYAGEDATGGELTVYHFDLYRLGSGEELEDIGGIEFFADPHGVSLVEWADRMPEVLPESRWEVCLEHGTTADERLIRWRHLVAKKVHGREIA
ncbi:MAG TPA: tRNA (adenosine(37)-N6)-threonylcarbamoyltransferase complex ATPase subunit type 1 TsaE [Candidatus Latescibacteria bacterium]|nr:tRNA (adenosine(37)-N6)-threonylcarbamoyltransferase complex ATPase subunit type 1 TsaE [Candidatus Latescibacterota bacterium]